MSVARAQREISSKEFGEWKAYENVEPGNPQREDLRAALICATVANASPNRRSGFQYLPKHFMLKFEDVIEQKPTANQLKMKLLAWKSGIDAKAKKDAMKNARKKK